MADFVIGTARDTSLYIQIGSTRYPLNITTEAKDINGLSDTIIEVLRNDKQLLTEIVDYLLHNTNLLSDYAKKSDISTVYKYKGSVNTYSALPEAKYNTIGDVYNIIQADETNKINAGDNVVWTGTAWDNLAGIVKIDLSPTVFNVTGKDDVLTVTKGDGSSYNIVINKVGHATTADSATSASKFTNVETATFTINADRPVWMSDSSDSNKPVKGNLTYNTSTNTLTLGTTNNGQIIGNATSSNYLTFNIIASNTDLNTITTPGEYGSNTDVVTGTLKNLPYAVKSDNTAQSFHLSVFKDINSNYIKQILITYSDGRVWYRYINGNKITPWTKFNSGTADTLTTGRTIQTNLASTNSATFNGSANITPGVSGILAVTNGGTGSNSLNSITVGNAKTADVLTTGRTIQTNLASTNAATFNGSTNVTPGVSGVLPVANGGTGTNDLENINVGSATKLKTARTITTNLASTTAGSFDGTANVTPGVTGILPVANGGTGSNALSSVSVGNSKTADALTTGRTVQTNLASTSSAAFDGTKNITPGVSGVLPVSNGGTGSNTLASITVGKATSADKLATARTIITNLASTNSSAFDGSANITPGISGILPVANGGTGSNSLNSITVGNATIANSIRFNIIPTNTDLNTITTPGEYGSGTDVDTGTLKNLPYAVKSDNTAESFHLSVFYNINNGHIKQVLSTYYGGEIWFREIVDGNKVTAWAKFNSGTADKLATARTIITNLASTSAASFDGTANVTPGVTGVLPVANGGTGSNSLSSITVGKATADANGNNINSTYVKSVTYSGHTVTVTKGNGTTSTFNTADTNTTYPVATTTANGLMSSTDKTKLNGIATGAEVNQNAFSNVTVGTTTIAADAKTDTLTLVAGTNITLTPDATNDKITIASTATVASSDLDKKVNRAGDTMTGALNFVSNAANKVGTSVSVGDHGLSGSLGVKSQSSGNNTGISLMSSSATTWTSTTEAGRIEYNSTTKSIDFVFVG